MDIEHATSKQEIASALSCVAMPYINLNPTSAQASQGRGRTGQEDDEMLEVLNPNRPQQSLKVGDGPVKKMSNWQRQKEMLLIDRFQVDDLAKLKVASTFFEGPNHEHQATLLSLSSSISPNPMTPAP